MQGGELTTYVLLADFVASEADETGCVARTRGRGVGIVEGPDAGTGPHVLALELTRNRWGSLGNPWVECTTSQCNHGQPCHCF